MANFMVPKEMFKSHQDKIKEMLDEAAEKDPLFAISYQKPNKSLKECAAYVATEIVKAYQQDNSFGFKVNGGVGVFGDDSVLANLAIHYYDEDDIKVEIPEDKPKTEAPASAPTPAPAKAKGKAKTAKKAEPAPQAKIEDDELPDDLIIPIF